MASSSLVSQREDTRAKGTLLCYGTPFVPKHVKRGTRGQAERCTKSCRWLLNRDDERAVNWSGLWSQWRPPFCSCTWRTGMAYAPEQNTLTALAASLRAQMQQQAQVPGQSSSSSVATSTTPATSSLAQIPQHAQAPGQLSSSSVATSNTSAASNQQDSRWHSSTVHID